jgi:hypothetical protein
MAREIFTQARGEQYSINKNAVMRNLHEYCFPDVVSLVKSSRWR